MKALLIFNQLNDIVFLHYDEGFRRYMHKRSQAEGLTEDENHSGPLDPNVVMQLFSPFVASIRFMTEQVRNPYKTIRCENGFLFVVEQYHDETLMAINGDSRETEILLRRKLLFLQRLLRFLFGPCDEEIRKDKFPERDTRWHFISRLLDTWMELYHSEQSFLVEAVERLHVNQLLNAKCIQLLEMTLSAVRTTGGEKAAVHALIMVNSKLLSLFSMKTAYELLPSDLLLLTVLVKACFPMRQKLEDFFSQSVAVGGAGPIVPPEVDQYQSAHEETEPEDSEEHEYFSSAPSSPGRKSPIEERSPVQGEPMEHPYMPQVENIAKDSQEGHGELDEDPEELMKTFYRQFNEDKDVPTYQRFTVMLGTPICKYTPHTAHCIEVMPGIVLVVLCESQLVKISGAICQTVSVLRAILHNDSLGGVNGKQTLAFLDANMKTIMDMLKKLRGTGIIDRMTSDILTKWDKAKSFGLLAYLDNPDFESGSSRVENVVASLLARLKDLFRVLYLSPQKLWPESQLSLTKSMDYCQRLMRQHLYDYKEYLAVKAQRNITMTTFVEEFPGLVHFLYVDRTMHQMTAPSINIAGDMQAGKVDMMRIIKANVWEKIVDMQSRLKKGHLTQILRDGDFMYSYFLWFEDGMGHPVQLSHTYEGIKDNVIPGILAGGFYRLLHRQVFPSTQQQNLRCYELIMVHVGLVPTNLVLRHGSKLAAMMWETTGEAHSPFALL